MAEIRERMRTRYPRQMLGMMAVRVLGLAMLAAVTIGLGAALASWAGWLMLQFPEWVPEVLVNPDHIAQRFRELTETAAAPLQFRTPEMASIRFYGGMIRWGIVLTLLGWGLGAHRKERLAESRGA